MTFSNEWEDVYKQGDQYVKWPWSDIISLFYKYAGHSKKVLEVGCGTGPNILFFNSIGVEYYGVEGSMSAVKYIHKRYPELTDKIIVGDFTNKSSYPKQRFDLVFDRASISHNSYRSIKKTINIINDLLVDGGIFIGVDWFSDKHACFKDPDTRYVDQFTVKGFKEGQFKGISEVHFSSEEHIRGLFDRFELLSLSEKTVVEVVKKRETKQVTWNIVIKKKTYG